MKRLVPVILCISLLVCVIAAAGLKKQAPEPKESDSTQNQISTADSAKKEADEMRGLWVTYFDLSMANMSDKSEGAFKNKFEGIAKAAKERKFNTLIVQVRPFCDALYNSEYFPHSHVLSGTQGEYIGYDALEIMCGICRKYGLKIHAWVNPYRVRLNETPQELSEDNPYFYDDPLCIETDSQIVLDPSNEEARELIINGIREIAENYDVDGIQFDDYFYPPDISDCDSEQYEAYCETAGDNAMDIYEWRKANVNLLIAQTYIAIHAQDKDIEFGISPQGNLGNNEGISADVVSWCGAKGYIDYICPQIYFSLDNPKLGYEAALNEWSALRYAEGVKLYVGLAGYKAQTDADDGTWQDENDILSKEYQIARNDPKVSGIMLYSSASLSDNKKKNEIDNLTKQFDS